MFSFGKCEFNLLFIYIYSAFFFKSICHELTVLKGIVMSGQTINYTTIKLVISCPYKESSSNEANL